MMNMMLSSLLLACTTLVYASSNAIGSKGFRNITTSAFTLELDVANQVATRLLALPGPNAGTSSSNFLLSSQNRSDDGYYYLGDIQIRMRPQGNNTWTDVASHSSRKSVITTPGRGNVLTSSDLTASLGTGLPITVVRTWSKDGDSIVMTFNITNVGNTALEMGGVGIPLPYNDDWVGKDQTSTWTQSVVSDPAISLDAGYVITNRLTGLAPSLITAPVERTPLEQYRLNYPSEPDYPTQWLDKTPLDYQYEGTFSWWMASAGLTALDKAAAKDLGFSRGSDYNTPTSFVLPPKASRIVGLRLFTANGPRAVEDRLVAYKRPTIASVPGFVVSSKDQIKVIVRSTTAPTIANITPPFIDFKQPVALATGMYAFSGTVRNNTFGQSRVTFAFANGETGTAHYNIIHPPETQLDNLGSFRFSKQWYSNSSDFFGRGPSVITYDNQKKQQVLDDPRAWVAGLSDEAGTGAYVSAAAKQLGRPDKAQIAMLEHFATKTLWGRIQISTPGSSYGGVQKSLFYYDSALEGKGVYQPGIDHSGTWSKQEASLTSRSYDYPHPTVVYWILYRLARNNVGLTTVPWTWYLDRAYDTIIAMRDLAGLADGGQAQFGLMEGTYFQMVLLDLTREGQTNSTLASRAQNVTAFMKQRADLWNSETYPYGSEFPWDNTAQEEVYTWCNYFGYYSQAKATIETLMAIMPNVPHWGYSGSGRDLWDLLFSGQAGNGARLERVFHHYKGSQSALPLVNQFQAYPSDIKMLRAGYSGVIGPLTSIGSDGFGSTGFHTRPDYLNWDPLSGDNGVNLALHALSTRAVVVNDTSLGGWAGFGAQVTQSGTTITIVPTDSFRQRVFIAANAFYMELDAGHFNKVVYDTSSRKVMVTLDPNDGHTPSARIRWTTSASTPSSGKYTLSGSYKVERGCSVIPLGSSLTTIKFGQ